MGPSWPHSFRGLAAVEKLPPLAAGGSLLVVLGGAMHHSLRTFSSSRRRARAPARTLISFPCSPAHLFSVMASLSLEHGSIFLSQPDRITRSISSQCRIQFLPPVAIFGIIVTNRFLIIPFRTHITGSHQGRLEDGRHVTGPFFFHREPSTHNKMVGHQLSSGRHKATGEWHSEKCDKTQGLRSV